MNRVILLLMSFTLAACTQVGRDLHEEMISGSEPVIDASILDSDKFIEDSSIRSKEVMKLGPVVSDVPTEHLRNDYRELINKDEPHDYVSFHEQENTFRVDLNIENMDIRTYGQMLSEITGINILVSDEVGGVVSARLEDVPWTQALDSVLQIKSLAKHIDKQSNIIRIHDQSTIVALENFERNRREALQRTLELDKAAEPLYTEVFKLFYTRPENIRPMIESVLDIEGENNTDFRNTEAQITEDARLNQLIITATKSDMEIISKLIKKVDSRTKQVLIEAFVVEVSDDFQQAFGTRVGLDGSASFRGVDNKSFNGGVTGLGGEASPEITAGGDQGLLSNLGVASTSGIGILAGIGSAADLKLELTALEQEGLSKVISNPRIFTLDNQEAIIFQGSEVPYTTVSSEGTRIEFRDAGLRLAVTPTIVGDGNIVMSLLVEKDTVDTSVENPPITSSSMTTSLVSKDGEIVVIGGIYTVSEVGAIEKVPFFGDLPYVGKVFKSDTRTDSRDELMIFIAPRVL
ncbi:MAG: type IV pilus secretin PilQ [Rickettsiales bacterium]|nr:type IV pilus secretin PilQ [Rickettsiales bacterium]